MTEINERLARFIWPDAKKIELRDGWLEVDWSARTGWVYEGLPFTESLDAQAKYLWPKLEYVSLVQIQTSFSCVVNPKVGTAKGAAIEDSPALASAQAIYKLLEDKP